MKNCCICEKTIADPDTAVLTGAEGEQKAICADCAKRIAKYSDYEGAQSKAVNTGAVNNNAVKNNAAGNTGANIDWVKVLRITAIVFFFLTVFLGLAYAIQVGGVSGFGVFIDLCGAAVFMFSIIMVFAQIAEDVAEIKKNSKNKKDE